MNSGSPPLRIAMLGTKGVPATFGGIERHVEELGALLAARGHQVTVHCRRNYTYPSREKCKVVSRRHWRYRGMDLRLLPSIGTKHLDAITHTALAGFGEMLPRHDIVHFHALGPSLLSFLPRLTGRRVVATVHGLDWQRRKWGLLARTALRAGEWAVTRWPHETIVVSKTLLDHFAAGDGSDKSHKSCVTYIPNGVTLPELLPPREITERWGLRGGDYHLFLSRLVPEKRADVLIRAFRELETPRKLVIAGGSSMSDDHVALLHQLAAGDPRILFTGNVTGDTFAELMSNAYLFILPSELEGLPIVVLEALSFGRCVLASDIAVNREVLEPGGEPWGALFRTNDVESLRDALARLDSDPATVDQFGGAARERVKSSYSWDDIADKTEVLYQQLTAPTRR